MIVVEGQGLHGAAPSSVTFSRIDGPSLLVRGGVDARLDALTARASARSTHVEGRVSVATVEHLFAAIAALGARRGLRIELDGPEVPLADGGARAFADAILALGIVRGPPRLRVARDADLDVGSSRYAFRCADGVSVEVYVAFDDARIAPHARWDGDPDDFVERIAIARTFGFEREIEELAGRGLASHVSPESVVVFARGAVLAAGRPYAADEPARHKLLDLVGDLGVHGGPPWGAVSATRPGHAATHEAVRRALDAGILAQVP